MSTQLENTDFDCSQFQYHLPQIYRSVLKEFKRIAQASIHFNTLFLSIIGIELAIFIPFATRPALFACALGGLFLTGFCYFVLLFYYQARKPELLLHLKKRFLQSCRQHIATPQGEAQHHLAIADALVKLSAYLQNFESDFYSIPPLLQWLTPLIRRFSVFFYGRDVFKMKQLLLQTAIEEHLKQIRITPTDLEMHASLASTYVALSKLHREALPAGQEKYSAALEEQFRFSAKLAIEEFKILNDYAPNDPWIHEQLAQGYKDLQMPKEELFEVEMLFKLRPQDKEILLRLGSLCFQQGMNARGLQIYEELKQSNFKQAEELIASYGTSRVSL
ncbi:MAG: hypothetical protein HY861_02465 [Chlamydiia bacterium]|nr:hypothetical protein [Chlamydiia bacterium]